jgi:hypothetical protein
MEAFTELVGKTRSKEKGTRSKEQGTKIKKQGTKNSSRKD